MSLTILPEQLTRALCRIALGLTVIHIACQLSRWALGHDSVFGIVPLFDLNAEANVPTFYASLSLTLCAALMAVIARVASRRRERYVLHWSVLAGIMLFLALDEFASLHERLSDPVRSVVDVGGVLTSAWVLPYGVAGLLLALGSVSFLRSLPARTRSLLLVGGATFVMGALGMEMVAGPAKEAAAGSPSLMITVFTTLEEVLEMAGVVICIHGLTTYLASRTGSVSLRLGPGGGVGSSDDADPVHVTDPRGEASVADRLFRSAGPSTH